MDLDRLRQHAQVIALNLGCKSFCPELAEQDFRTYLESDFVNPYYPRWGSKVEWLRFAMEKKSQSGHGNPLSPLYFVGSELAADIDAYQPLYFKFCFDLLWQELLNCKHNGIHETRLRKNFLKYWGGAGDIDKLHGYHQAPYYQTLRYAVMNDSSLWQEQSYPTRHIEWHSNGNRTSTGHYWNKVSALLRLILKDPYELLDKRESCLSCCNTPKTPFPGFGNRVTNRNNLSNYTIDDLAFFTESNMDTASAGSSGIGFGYLNEFFLFALRNFIQKRIFIFSPKQKNINYNCTVIQLPEALRKELNKQGRVVEQLPGNNNYPIAVYRHYRGHFAIVVHTNLSQSVDNENLAILLHLVRKYARRI